MRRALAILCFIVAVLVPGAALALPPTDSWAMMNPSRLPTQITDIAVNSSGVGWAAGAVPLRSPFPGADWSPVSGRLTQSSTAMVSVGGTSTVVLGGGTKLEVSNDGGSSWALVDTQATFSALDGVFADTNEGWVVGSGGVIVHTTDAGHSWTPQASGVSDSITTVDYAGGALFALAGSKVLCSTDRGATWTVRTPTPTGVHGDLDFVSAQTGVVVGSEGVFRTMDGGASWKRVSTAYFNPSTTRVVFKDALTGWIHPTMGDTLMTKDGGLTWSLQYTVNDYRDRFGAPAGHSEIVDGYWAPGSSIGWRYDYDDVFYTIDSGARWISTTAYSFTSQDIVDISFESSTTGFVATTGGGIYKTQDSGALWTRCTTVPVTDTGAQYNFNGVQKLRGGRGFAAGEDLKRGTGIVLRTDANGTTWQTLRPPVTGALKDVWSNDGVKVWAVGEEGSIVRSFTGGDVWSVRGAAAAAGADLTAVEVLPSGVGYAVGTGRVLKTTDDGSTWTTATVPPYTTLLTLDVVDENVLWVGTGGGRAYRSVDGGTSWTTFELLKLPKPAGSYDSWVREIRAVSATEAVTGFDRLLWTTSDGGAHWTPIPINPDMPTLAFDWVGDDMWVGGLAGRLHYNAHGQKAKLPPSTMMVAPSGWNRQPVDVKLYPIDSDGVAQTYFRFNGPDSVLPTLTVDLVPVLGNWTSLTAPQRVTRQGKTTVQYFSVDRLGNVEPLKARSVYVDTVVPKIYFTAKSSYRKNSVIKVKAGDSTSGVSKIVLGVSTSRASYLKTYRSTYASYKLTRKGRWNLDVIVTDKAGNVKIYRKRIRVY